MAKCMFYSGTLNALKKDICGFNHCFIYLDEVSKSFNHEMLPEHMLYRLKKNWVFSNKTPCFFHEICCLVTWANEKALFCGIPLVVIWAI